MKITVPEELTDLIPDFIQRRKIEIKDCYTLVQTDQLERIADIGHSLKGHAPGYGFELLGQQAADLEKAAKSGDRDKVITLLEEMEDHIESVEF
jgi:HPt (histidine-containing phosphotransfer) domain-containing protein